MQNAASAKTMNGGKSKGKGKDGKGKGKGKGKDGKGKGKSLYTKGGALKSETQCQYEHAEGGCSVGANCPYKHTGATPQAAGPKAKAKAKTKAKPYEGPGPVKPRNARNRRKII